jgi:hypothetical protein
VVVGVTTQYDFLQPQQSVQLVALAVAVAVVLVILLRVPQGEAEQLEKVLLVPRVLMAVRAMKVNVGSELVALAVVLVEQAELV